MKLLVALGALLLLLLSVPQLVPSPYRQVVDSSKTEGTQRQVFIAFVPFYKWGRNDGVDGFEVIVKDQYISDTETISKVLADVACAPGTPYDKTTCSTIPGFSLTDNGTLKTNFVLRNEKYKDLPKNPGKMLEGFAKGIGKLNIKKANPLERRLSSVAELDVSLELAVHADPETETVTVTKQLVHVPAKQTRGFVADVARVFDPELIKKEIDNAFAKKAGPHVRPESLVLPPEMPGELIDARFIPDPDGQGFAVRLLLKREPTTGSILLPYVLMFRNEISADSQ